MPAQQTIERPRGPRLARVRPAFDPAFYGIVKRSPLPLPDERGELKISAPATAGSPSPAEMRVNETLKKARAYMRENLGDPELTIDQVAEAVCLSKRQLQRLFKRAESPGFRAELTKMRMEEAARLLHAPDTVIADVSRQVGYLQPMHFSKAFRRQFNCSPSDYRAQRRDQVDA